MGLASFAAGGSQSHRKAVSTCASCTRTAFRPNSACDAQVQMLNSSLTKCYSYDSPPCMCTFRIMTNCSHIHVRTRCAYAFSQFPMHIHSSSSRAHALETTVFDFVTQFPLATSRLCMCCHWFAVNQHAMTHVWIAVAVQDTKTKVKGAVPNTRRRGDPGLVAESLIRVLSLWCRLK